MICKVALALAVVASVICWGCGDAVDDGPDETPPFVPAPIPNRAPVPVPSAIVCVGGTLLTYENFGAAFLTNHCSSCHASVVTGSARAGAPEAATFDTAREATTWRALIAQRALGKSPSMPPTGAVPANEFAMLTEWISCGAPER